MSLKMFNVDFKIFEYTAIVLFKIQVLTILMCVSNTSTLFACLFVGWFSNSSFA